MKRIIAMLSFVFALTMALTAMPVSAAEEADAAAKDTVDVYVCVDDIEQGTCIEEDQVKKITVKNKNIPANVISDFSKIDSLYAKRNLYANEYISEDQLSDKKVSKVNQDLLKKKIVKTGDTYLNVTDYVIPNTGEDISFFLQEIIDKNPNRTLYFPDGVYTIAYPLQTSAVGRESVSFQLSDGAVIKASNNWRGISGSAMICFGGAQGQNDIVSVGSYYTFVGGTIDGNNRASGIAIVSGRESVIRNVCIRNPLKGIIIEKGANGNSADIDFEDITIIGNGMPGTVGIQNVAHDNTYTNIRIYDMEIGAENLGGEVASIYVVNTEKSAKNIARTVGVTGASRMSHCVTVNCATGFKLGWSTLLFDCVSVWTSNQYKKQTMFYIKDQKTVLSGCKAFFATGEGVSANLYELKSEKQTPVVEACFINE